MGGPGSGKGSKGRADTRDWTAVDDALYALPANFDPRLYTPILVHHPPLTIRQLHARIRVLRRRGMLIAHARRPVREQAPPSASPNPAQMAALTTRNAAILRPGIHPWLVCRAILSGAGATACYCDARYQWRQVRRQPNGDLIGPAGCGHGLDNAWFLDPATGAILRPYSL